MGNKNRSKRRYKKSSVKLSKKNKSKRISRKSRRSFIKKNRTKRIKKKSTKLKGGSWSRWFNCLGSGGDSASCNDGAFRRDPREQLFTEEGDAKSIENPRKSVGRHFKRYPTSVQGWIMPDGTVEMSDDKTFGTRPKSDTASTYGESEEGWFSRQTLADIESASEQVKGKSNQLMDWVSLPRGQYRGTYHDEQGNMTSIRSEQGNGRRSSRYGY
jgi:hypothetical protein